MDVDRYVIDKQERDTVLAVRELNQDGLTSHTWINDHTVYTHGYGVVAAYGNVRNPDGNPDFYEQGIPTAGAFGDYEARIYFGENSPDYSIVGAPKGRAPVELDYPADNAGGQKQTTYAGSGGVSMGSFLNRFLYALKFREQNILLSDAVNSQSRILYDRSPKERVQKVAPYLTLDGDPYPAVVDRGDGKGKRVLWIMDGYTTSNRYPYSRLIDLNDYTSDSTTTSSANVAALQAQQVNYMRNSVKAVVDAYDGSVSLYAWDDQDPVLRAWMKTFPATVKPMSDMPGDLMAHVRYPEDLFKVQRRLLARYHVTDATSYYNNQDAWAVPNDPTDDKGNQQPAYYLTLQMPGMDRPRFSLTSTYIPQKGNQVLTGFLAVDGDAGTQSGVKRDGYGTLRLLQLPKTTSIPGPAQVQNKFSAFGTTLNILRSNGSKVENGNLLTLPLGGGLLYVQPVYVKANLTTGAYPLLQKVLVVYGDKAGFDDTLDGALNQVFGATASAGTGSGTTPSTGAGGSTTTPSPSSGASAPSGSEAATAQVELTQALQDAQAALTAGQAALAKGDFAGYGVQQQALKSAIARALAAQAKLAAAAGRSASPSTSASASSPSASSPSAAGTTGATPTG
jgi:uncharacterized membrane protein (UPF0182 family)